MSDAIPVNRIKGVGEKTAALFGKINVYTVDDLIRHYPRDYETYGAPVSIRETSPGSVQAVYGQITAIPNVKKVRNLSILNAILKDDNGDSYVLAAEANEDGTATAVRKNIKVGEEVDYYTEVTGGDLKEGDQLIYDNTFSVTEGQVFTPEQIYSNQALDTEGMMSTEAE